VGQSGTQQASPPSALAWQFPAVQSLQVPPQPSPCPHDCGEQTGLQTHWPKMHWPASHSGVQQVSMQLPLLHA
jgi:hypothetical protein